MFFFITFFKVERALKDELHLKIAADEMKNPYRIY